MRICLLILAGLGFSLPTYIHIASAQTLQSASSENSQSRDAPLDLQIPTLRVTTHEVLVDLIALNRHNQPVLDLKPDELQISEAPEPEKNDRHKKKHKSDPITSPVVFPITSLSIFDPSNPNSSRQDTGSGFRILASCLERSTIHYLLAFHPGPSASTAGHHHIAITTVRPDTKLFYRHQYYVGLAPDPGISTLKQAKIDQFLQQSACYYPVTPLSISLHAHLIDTGRADVVRYLVSADASSLSFLTVSGDSATRSSAGLDRRIELDYGTCNFDENGKPASYFHAPLDKVLNSADYARALDRGFPHILEFPASDHIALTRIVLRDRATGNLGAADVILPPREQTSSDHFSHDMLGSFGSIVPAPRAFCGDVYELSGYPSHLPDFRELDPIGSVYAPSLNAPAQFFSNSSGIPGVTPRTDLFGIDYHATFWVSTGGEYEFRLSSDDGAILQIDDRNVINLDGLHQYAQSSGIIQLEPGLHVIHVPYFQGAPVAVALELSVKPPHASKWAVFDLSDYQPPPSSPISQGESEHPR